MFAALGPVISTVARQAIPAIGSALGTWALNKGMPFIGKKIGTWARNHNIPGLKNIESHIPKAQ